MNGDDEPLSGLNGRLRPRKSAVQSPQAPKPTRKPENKPVVDRPKRTSTPSKAAATKTDDLAYKSDSPTAPQLLCPYCDRKFASKQTVSKHARRIHLSKQDSFINCLFCTHSEADNNDIIRHMVDSHPNQYYACLDCHTRFITSSELAEHKLNVCEKQKEKPYRSKLRQKVSSGSKKNQKTLKLPDDKDFTNDNKVFPDGHCFNGVVISCELKPAQVTDEADIEDNITTNLILPPSKNLGSNAVIEKNAVIVLDDIQWNKRMPTNFSFHNTDADQILSRLGVVHRSPRTGESTKKDWFRNADEPVQKFEKCFDTGFYSKVASNVHENLAKFLDGSFNFNPDPDSIIKTRKSKQSVVINTAEGFPILLAFQQFSRNMFDGYMPRTLAPKHKWKWENDKNPLIPVDIKRDNHVNNCIITLVSSLDIWTQLCMRRKFEEKFSIPPLEKKTEKQNIISKELKEILESRELPSSSQQPMKHISKPMPPGDSLDFPASLGLKPSAPAYDMQPAVLSGEWVRPRCYVCCACGAQTRDSRGLSSHISTQHPNAQVQHYEIVGELLLNADILKHLYVPPSQMCNRTRPLRGFRECTKCKKSISLEDLHQHMLDCAGDTPAVRRKCRYRPFGVRRRRARLPDNTIRKKIRKDIRSRQTRQKTHMRPRPKIRSEVGDAETIRKMLADLPAKRHRVMVNPMNPSLRPRRKLDKQRNKIIMKRRSSEMARNRKQREQRELKKGSMSNPSRSTTKENDENDSKSNKSDDENKPLKPRMKRVLTHAPRTSDTLKRKVALNRAKRRVKMKEQKLAEDSSDQQQPTDTPSADGAGTSGNDGDQLSTDNQTQRVDVGGGPYNTREQSSRGSRSNNRDSRDDQLPGSSGSQNGNLNNPFGPMHNAPLKHSIARLTAETDIPERSLQYHHLFLMQPPESTELDLSQHVPSGQQRVFENEAVVTKLDKPPLHFNLPAPLDAYAYHKNKLPKPKKGLNDCIAMLKNKLTDPIPTTKVSQSVQCGNEDRLECERAASDQRPPVEYTLNMNQRPTELYARHPLIPERYMEYPGEASLIAQNFAELPFHFVPTPRIPFEPPPPEIRIDSRFVKTSKQKHTENKKETAPRRRSTRSDKSSVAQDLNVLTSLVGYPVNMASPAKVNSVQGRRSSTQSGPVIPNATTRRRSSVSHSRSNAAKLLSEYDMAMAHQRALEYHHAQRISPDAHLMEVTLPETFNQAQINKQNQLMASQIYAKQMMLENYVNKEQLAICVDNSYSHKMLSAAFAESLYTNSKNLSVSPRDHYRKDSHSSVSPGNRYENGKQSSVSPGNRYDSSINQSVSPGSRYDPTNNAADKRYDNNMHLMTSPSSGYNNSKYGLDSSLSNYAISKPLTLSPTNKQDSNKQTNLSPGSNADNKKALTASPGSRHDHPKRLTVSPAYVYDSNKQDAISPGNQYEHNKRIDGGSASRYETVERVVNSGISYETSGENDTSKNKSSFSERQYDSGKQLLTTTNSLNLDVQFDNGNPVDVSPNRHYVGSKVASNSPRTKYGVDKYGNLVSENQCDSSKLVSPRSQTDVSDSRPLSPGRQLDSRKYLPVSSESQHVNLRNLNVGPRTSYDASKHGALLAPETEYDIRKHVASSPVNLENSNSAKIHPEAHFDYNQYANISPRSVETSDRHYDIRQHGNVSTVNQRAHSNPSVIPGNQVDNRKYASTSDGLIGNSQHVSICRQSDYDTSEQRISGPDNQPDEHPRITASPQRQMDNRRMTGVGHDDRLDENSRVPISPRHSYDAYKHGVLIDTSHQQTNVVHQYDSRKFSAVSSDNGSNVAMTDDNHFENSHHFKTTSGNYHDGSKLSISISTSQYEQNKHFPANPVCDKQIFDNPRKHLDAIKLAAKMSETSYDENKHIAPNYEPRYENFERGSENPLESDKLDKVVPESCYQKKNNPVVAPGNVIGDIAVNLQNKINNNTHAQTRPGVNENTTNYGATDFEGNNKYISASAERNYDDTKQGRAFIETSNQVMNSLVGSSPFEHSRHSDAGSDSSYNNKHRAISSETTSNSSFNAAVSNTKQTDNNKQPIISTGNVIDNRELPAASSGSNYDNNKQYITKKQAAVAADSNYNNNKHLGTTSESHYINKKQAATSELIYHKKNSVPERFYSKSYEITSSDVNDSLPNKNTNYDENTFISKKSQAIAAENKMLNKAKAIFSTEASNMDNTLPSTEKPINKTQDLTEDKSKSLSTNRTEDILIVKTPNLVESIRAVKPINDVKEPIIEDQNIRASSHCNKYKDLEVSTDNIVRNPSVYAGETNLATKNLPDDHLARQPTSSQISIEYYREHRYMHAILPPPYVGLNSKKIETDDVELAPLDLSKTTIEEYVIELPQDDKHDDYETLDLSKKISGKPNESASVISKLAAANSSIGSDVSAIMDDVSEVEENNTPTDLSIKRNKITYRDLTPVLSDTKTSPGSETHVHACVLPRVLNCESEDSLVKENRAQTQVGKPNIIMKPSIPMIRKDLHSEKEENNLVNCELRIPVGGCPLTSGEGYGASFKDMQHKLQQPITSACAEVTSPLIYKNSKLMNDNVVNVDDKTFACTVPTSATIEERTNTELACSVFPSRSNSASSSMMSKHESTTPVYTLANTCISKAKVEPSNIGSFSDTISSVPSTTIVSVSPVYTSTSTADNPTMNQIIKHNYPCQDVTSNQSKPCLNKDERSKAPDGHLKKTDSSSSCNDLDPETAKKIAMLPKELVEILGTMPVDHRNQLLNVLPQYVSTPAVAGQNDIPNISTASVVNRGVSPPRISDLDVKPSIGHSPVSSSQTMRPVISSVERFDETKSFYQPTVESKSLVEVAKYEPSEQMPKVYEIDGNTVIDLTEEDVPQNSEIKLITEQPNDSAIKIIDPASVTPITKPSKQKNNDQTASLRAVRIKTPSERNKSVSNDNMPVIKSSIEQTKSHIDVSKHNSNSIDLDKTLAIQQAEISSTQHNTTIAGGCKYPLALSPSSTEYSGDELNKPVPQQSPAEDVIVKETLVEPTVPKTAMVSSSITTSEENPAKCIDNIVDVSLPQTEVVSNIPHLPITAEGSNISDDKTTKLLECQKESSEHQEDSDDDISLAAIVKQKQRDQENISSISKKTIGKGNKKKKEKRGKKTGKKLSESSLKESSTSVKLKDVDCQEPNCVPSDTYSVKSNEDVINTEKSYADSNSSLHEKADSVLNLKHRKKGSKRGKVSTTPHITELQKLDCVGAENEKDINKENDSTSEVVNKVNIEENDSSGNKETFKADNGNANEPDVNKTKVKQHIIKEITSDPVIKLNKCDDKPSAHSVKINDFTKAKEKQKPELPKADASVPEENNDLSTIVPDKNENDKTKNYKISESTDKSLTKPEQENKTLLEMVDPKKSKRTQRCKKTKTDISRDDQQIENIENVEKSLEIKETVITPTTVTPLRRSRRGKSLFLEGTSTDDDPAELSEVIVEHKTPLTKKQLIFSKLLLDEENPRPAAHSTPEKQDKDSSDVVIDGKEVELPEISAIDNVDDLSSEKSKGTKRRINAQLPKKSKKKKSFEEVSSSLECADESKPQIKEATEVKTKVPFEAPKPSNTIEDKDELTNDDKCDSNNIKSKLHEMYNNKNNNNDDKPIVSSEKRKHSNQISFDLSQSSKPKKCRMTKIEKNMDMDAATDKTNSENNALIVDSSANTSETKTACYNLPLPARRARSKSVVVKSSTYDPYDIDLEDMAEQNEMFKKKESLDYVSKTAKTIKLATTKKEIIIDTKEERKDNRDSDIDFNEKVSDHENNDYDLGAVSDSGDSSKSDIPLKKYVEEKEKKIQEVETKLLKDTKTPSDKQPNVDDKTTKRITSSEAQKVTQSEAEEELRSEQFMESFGFFSERKPRKSNLLATKKISETFHITNESDDMYFGFKERTGKRSLNVDNKKSIEPDTSKPPTQTSTSKRTAPKRGRKKKAITKIMPCYCGVCKKEFRRSDNYLRHQMSLSHITKLSEVELKIKIIPHHEEPNYLVAYKQYLDRLKKLTDILVLKKKKFPKAASKIVLPTLEQILSDVNKKVRDQQRCGLSRDEALFLDCCELLKESHVLGERGRYGMSGLDILEKALNDMDTNEYISDDGDCDSITAQNILESEEVRNLENDLISGLKEAANATRNANMEYQHSLNEFAAPQVVQMVQLEQAQQAAELEHAPIDNQEIENTQEVQPEEFSSPNAGDSHYDHMEDYDLTVKPRSGNVKKHFEIKEKMYPDILIEDIDMFEDKFDKIKRKCRSQAAAAKQIQPVVDRTISHKGRKKSDKKKGKRSSKKARHQSSHVPTKGALKGFDGIRVSIPTSDINISAIVPVPESLPKKKKKSSTKKKRGKRDSESSSKYDSDHRAKDSSSNFKKVDVYEFMDNEDAELFEFRASTLMERFKSISNNKDVPSSKFNPVVDDNSSAESASDGDDFVYMSDDYVGSGDDETENSLLSCELGNVKIGNDIKKNSPHKRKDAVEKIAVMGKIFKHNAVRAEKKVIVPKETEKPKANLDQLFDSLLEDEPNSSALNNEAGSPEDDDLALDKKPAQLSSKLNVPRKASDQTSDSEIFAYPNKSRSSSPGKKDGLHSSASLPKRQTSPAKDHISIAKKRENTSVKKINVFEDDYGPSTSKNYGSALNPIDYGPSTSKKYSSHIPKEEKKLSPKSFSSTALNKNDTINKVRNESTTSKNDIEMYSTYEDDLESPSNKPDEGISTSYDNSVEAYDQSVFEDETGVARQRARRKCTVGKQNVLAETWSSESEPDGGPPRPNSAESDIAGVSRKKKGRKREGQQSVGRRGNNRQVAFKKQDVESRVSSNRASSSAVAAGSSNVADYDPGEGPSGMCSAGSSGSSTGTAGGSPAGDVAAAAAAAAAAMPAPSTSAAAGPTNAKGRPRAVANYWTEGDDEQEHVQQHGWIVGDSHKKLVTMLAHAKGRKRNNDDKRHLVE